MTHAQALAGQRRINAAADCPGQLQYAGAVPDNQVDRDGGYAERVLALYSCVLCRGELSITHNQGAGEGIDGTAYELRPSAVHSHRIEPRRLVRGLADSFKLPE